MAIIAGTRAYSFAADVGAPLSIDMASAFNIDIKRELGGVINFDKRATKDLPLNLSASAGVF